MKQELADIAGVPLLRFARSQLIVELPGGHAATSNAAEPVAAAEPPPPAAAAEATTTKKRKHVKEPQPALAQEEAQDVAGRSGCAGGGGQEDTARPSKA